MSLPEQKRTDQTLSLRENIVRVAGRYYRRTSWPRRILARSLDVIFLIVICVVAGERFAPLAVPLAIVYLFVGNGLLAGRSLGKRLTGLRIVDARHGGPCSAVQDFVRHRYLFFVNPIFLLLTAYDASQGCFEAPETYVVEAKPLKPDEVEALKEKPAKLDLEAMRNR